MKKFIQKVVLGMSVLVNTTALNSCKKTVSETDFTTAYNQAMADETYDDASNIADEAATTGSVSYKAEEANSLLAGCATVTRDTVSTPHVCIVDFGSGCVGIDGRTRSGQIIVTYDGPYRQPGTTISITFNNYFVNGNQVLGTRTVHNDGYNADNHLSFSVNVTGQIILVSGGTINWTSARTRVWIAGENTPSRDDDQYSITGSAQGIAANGDQFSATIFEPLIRNLAPGCRKHFVDGKILHQKSGKPDKEIDFGNGACDDIAMVTVNGNTHVIHLH